MIINRINIKIVTFLLILSIWGCSREINNPPPTDSQEAGIKGITGTYKGTLFWAKFNPTSGDLSDGTDPNASLTVIYSGNDATSMSLTTNAPLSGSKTFSAKLSTKHESNPANTYVGDFGFIQGNWFTLQDGSNGLFSDVRIQIHKAQNYFRAILVFRHYHKFSNSNAQNFTFSAERN